MMETCNNFKLVRRDKVKHIDPVLQWALKYTLNLIE